MHGNKVEKSKAATGFPAAAPEPVKIN